MMILHVFDIALSFFAQSIWTKLLFLLAILMLTMLNFGLRSKFDLRKTSIIYVIFLILSVLLTAGMDMEISYVVFLFLTSIVLISSVVLYLIIAVKSIKRYAGPPVQLLSIKWFIKTNKKKKIEKFLQNKKHITYEAKITAYKALGQIGDAESIGFIEKPSRLNNMDLYKTAISAYAAIGSKTAIDELKYEITNNVYSDKFRIVADEMVSVGIGDVIDILKECLISPAETRLYIAKKLNEMGVHELDEVIKGDDADFSRFANHNSLDKEKMLQCAKNNFHRFNNCQDNLNRFEYLSLENKDKISFLQELTAGKHGRYNVDSQIEFILSLNDETSMNFLFDTLAFANNNFEIMFDKLADIDAERTADYAILRFLRGIRDRQQIMTKIQGIGITKYNETIRCDNGDYYRAANDENIDNAMAIESALKYKQYNNEDVQIFKYYITDDAEKIRIIEQRIIYGHVDKIQPFFIDDYDFISSYCLKNIDKFYKADRYKIHTLFKEHNDRRLDGKLTDMILSPDGIEHFDADDYNFLEDYFLNNYDYMSDRFLGYLNYLDDFFYRKIAGFYIENNDMRIVDGLQLRVISSDEYRKDFIIKGLEKLNVNKYYNILLGDRNDYKRIIDSGIFDCKALINQAERTIKKSNLKEYESGMELMLFTHYLEGKDPINTLEKMIMDNLEDIDRVKYYTSVLYDLGKKHWTEIYSSENKNIDARKINVDALVKHEDKLNVADIIRMFNYYNYKKEMATAFLSSSSVLKNLKALSYMPPSHDDVKSTHEDVNNFERTGHEDYWDGNTNPKRPMHYDNDIGDTNHTDAGENHTDRHTGDTYSKVDIDKLIKFDF